MRRYVDDATSIVARNDVNVDVDGNTHVKGALIKSEEGDVNIDTDTFTFEDIYNTDTYESSSFSVSGSYSTSGDNVSADPFAPSSGPSASASLQRDGVLDTISKLPTIEYENITSEKIGITRATVAADEGSVNINTTGDQTQDLASLNTDVDRMEETIKDEESHIGVYIDGPAMVETYEIVSDPKAKVEEVAEQAETLLKWAKAKGFEIIKQEDGTSRIVLPDDEELGNEDETLIGVASVDEKTIEELEKQLDMEQGDISGLVYNNGRIEIIIGEGDGGIITAPAMVTLGEAIGAACSTGYTCPVAVGVVVIGGVSYAVYQANESDPKGFKETLSKGLEAAMPVAFFMVRQESNSPNVESFPEHKSGPSVFITPTQENGGYYVEEYPIAELYDTNLHTPIVTEIPSDMVEGYSTISTWELAQFGGAILYNKISDLFAKEDTSVYVSLDKTGNIQYVGITNDFERRSREHLRSKGILTDRLIDGLSRIDAKAVEQVLIENYGLGKNGGTLLNRINSIAKTNPAYAASLQKGQELLKENNINIE